MRVHADFIGDEGHAGRQNHQAFGFPQVDGGVKWIVVSDSLAIEVAVARFGALTAVSGFAQTMLTRLDCATTAQLKRKTKVRMKMKCKIRKFTDNPIVPINFSGNASEIMDILTKAVQRCTDSKLSERYDVAIASLGMYYLKIVESSYEPVKNSYVVHIEREVKVSASDEDDAKRITKLNKDEQIFAVEKVREVHQ